MDDFPTPVSPRKMILAYEIDLLASLCIPQICENNSDISLLEVSYNSFDPIITDKEMMERGWCLHMHSIFSTN